MIGAAHRSLGLAGLLERSQNNFCWRQERTMLDEDRTRAVSLLNAILEAELAGVVRYTHYSFLVYGFGRIPIVSWLREQGGETVFYANATWEGGNILLPLL